MSELATWIGPVLDVAVMALLGAALWRLGDPSAAWRAREEGLREAVRALQTLIGDAERQARVLDERLAAHARALRVLVEAAHTDADGGDTTALGERVRVLAARAVPVEEIARRLDVPVAEARVLVALGETGRGGAAPGKNGAAESAA